MKAALLDRAPTAADMRGFVEALDGPHVVERSVKLRPGRVAKDRFLVTCQPPVLGPRPKEKFREIAETLRCDPAAIERLLHNWDRVLTVHLGCDGIEPPLFKLYVEYELGKSGRDDLPDDTLFLAAKWLPGQVANFSLYRNLPFPTNGIEAREALRVTYASEAGPASVAFTDRVLGELITPKGRVDVMLVEDEETPRKSFDINLYRINTPLARHKRALTELCQALEVPEAAGEILADGEGTMLGHIAIGRDAQGGEFVTLYYAMTQVTHG